MNADQEKRILVTVHWVSNEIFRFKGELLQPETMLNIAKAFMEIAAADGSLNDAERKWIVGYAAATGVSQEAIDELQNYQTTDPENAIKFFQNDNGTSYPKHLQLTLIYDGYRAAAADGELHPKEVEAINNLGRKLGITEEQLKQIHDLFVEEIQLRQKRVQLLFPKGADVALEKLKNSN